MEELKDLMEYECSTDDCRLLEGDVSAEEIRKVVFSMPSNKSPGPDGYPSEFYKTAWPVIGPDFIIAVQPVFQFGFLPKGINSTILTLIPKKVAAQEMRDYRPISCCNVVYKVVANSSLTG